MSSRRVPGFPAALEADLARLGRRLAHQEATEPLYASTMDALGQLPPQSISWADTHVAKLAGLSIEGWIRLWVDGVAISRKSTLQFLDRRPGFALLHTFHRDGHVREAALSRITEPPATPFFLAALAWRLNDWVPAVREAARHCAGRVLDRVGAGVIAGAAPLLLTRRHVWKRWDEAGAALIDGLYDRRAVVCLLVPQWVGGTTGPLATLLRHALRNPGFDEHLPCLFRDARQPAVRAAALQTLVAGRASWPTGYAREWIDRRFNLSRRVTVFAHRDIKHPWPTDALIRQGLRDRSSMVRRVAADALIQRPWALPDPRAIATELLRDPSAAVRERAAFLLRSATD